LNSFRNLSSVLSKKVGILYDSNLKETERISLSFIKKMVAGQR
jgi:hypothetical protein